MSGKKLSTYHHKSDLERSGKPSGGEPGDEPRFVVQKDERSSLGYDFRLEVDGVLKSWVVPKGPSLDPREKRLATPNEDHPLDYVEGEGEIPGGYGAATVVVWDTGTHRNDTERGGEPVAMADGLSAGHVKVWLDGEKLRGAFTLSRTDFRGREQWLLLKVDDEGADRRRNLVRAQPESVLTGRTHDELW
ncbi:DNA polymerase ligase N-terminal domain-containing protein [Saccharopolyspora spinosa]|uniref:DNA ligase D-like protein (Predicted 3'-phosphoesterase) n=1 Tax=Saccharopolyspora spinosa TaxID=60894 RepID=A0A2N3Y4U0_SACSN|nr:DNA polymerase ligase N-terminal domain-containing protein [Saccharopolyspora spinosa]PKW17841.1 DNA ligase D-like protein (predicted 3'-phosphoesterase) [Saccharopolyspora spinosa]